MLPQTTFFLVLLSALVLALAHVLLMLPHGAVALANSRLPMARNAALSDSEQVAATADLAAGWFALLAVVLLVLMLFFQVPWGGVECGGVELCGVV